MTMLISSSGPIKGYGQIVQGSYSSPWIAVKKAPGTTIVAAAYIIRELAEGESLRPGETMYERQENGEYLEVSQ